MLPPGGRVRVKGVLSIMRVTAGRKKEIFKGRIISLSLEEVALPQQTVEMECISHPGGAAVVPLLPDGSVVMIEQYRYLAGDFIWEIPAGRLEPGEDPRVCAARELEEEAGYRARSMEQLAAIYSAPAYSREIISIFLARGLTPGTQRLEADEMIRVVTLPIADAIRKVRASKVADAKTLTGLLLTMQYAG